MHDHSSSHLSSLRLKKNRLFRKAGTYSVILLSAVFLLFYVWQRVQVISIGYEIESLKKEKESLARTNRSLTIEAASLTAPDRVEAIASSEIGMKAPKDTQIILVKRVNRGGKSVPDESRKAEGPAAGPGRS